MKNDLDKLKKYVLELEKELAHANYVLKAAKEVIAEYESEYVQ